jgi:hypothetical protein
MEYIWTMMYLNLRLVIRGGGSGRGLAPTPGFMVVYDRNTINRMHGDMVVDYWFMPCVNGTRAYTFIYGKWRGLNPVQCYKITIIHDRPCYILRGVPKVIRGFIRYTCDCWFNRCAPVSNR